MRTASLPRPLPSVGWVHDCRWAPAPERSPGGPGHPPARASRLPGTGGRAAVPARGRGDRGAPRHPRARRTRDRRCGRADRGRTVRVPRLRHDRVGGPPRGCRGRARRPRAGRRRGLARRPDRHGHYCPRSALCRSARGTVRTGAPGGRPGHDVPPAGAPRCGAGPGHARRHRDPARPAGHPHPAGGRGRRQPGEHRREPRPRLRASPRHRRLGDRQRPGAARHRGRPGRGRGQGRATGGSLAAGPTCRASAVPRTPVPRSWSGP